MESGGVPVTVPVGSRDDHTGLQPVLHRDDGRGRHGPKGDIG